MKIRMVLLRESVLVFCLFFFGQCYALSQDEYCVGTAPFCSTSPSDCGIDLYVRDTDDCDGLENSCSSGHKVVCKKHVVQSSQYCKGTAPFCGASASDCGGDEYMGATDDCGGTEQTCWTGTKVLCRTRQCTGDDCETWGARYCHGTAPWCSASSSDCTSDGAKFVGTSDDCWGTESGCWGGDKVGCQRCVSRFGGCNAGQYLQNGVCGTGNCKSCGDEMYQPASSFMGQQCSECDSCSSDEYETLECTTTQNRRCASCANSLSCGDNEYRWGCGNGNIGGCYSCDSVWCPKGRYLYGCGGLIIGSCGSCPDNTYNNDEYNYGLGGCNSCDNVYCWAGSYLGGCGGENIGWCYGCPANTYSTVALFGLGRSCTPCASCENGQYRVGCGGSSAGSCVSYTPSSSHPSRDITKLTDQNIDTYWYSNMYYEAEYSFMIDLGSSSAAPASELQLSNGGFDCCDPTKVSVSSWNSVTKTYELFFTSNLAVGITTWQSISFPSAKSSQYWKFSFTKQRYAVTIREIKLIFSCPSGQESSSGEPCHCAPGRGGPNCDTCAGGSWSAGAGFDYCVSCTAKPTASHWKIASGASSNAGCSFGCSSGYGGSTCAICGVGKYSEGGSTDACKTCPAKPAHSYWSVSSGASGCSYKCDPGYGGSNCVICEAGTYSVGGGTAECSICNEKPTYSTRSDGASDCSFRCHAGYGGSTCAICAAGSYSPGGSTASCVSCSDAGSPKPQASTWVFSSGQVNQQNGCAFKCDAGTGGDDCAACASGFFSAGGSTDACSQCAAKPTHSTWKKSSSASDCAYKCDAGYGGPNCDVCPAGSWSNGGSTAPCSPCPQKPDTSTWDLASGGTDAQSACEFTCIAPDDAVVNEETCMYICLPGRGGDSCTVCPAGSWSAGGSTNACSICVEKPTDSTWTTAAGAVEQSSGCSFECTPGHGGTSCELCGAGSWSPGGSVDACAICDAKPEASTWTITSGGFEEVSACEYTCHAGSGGTDCGICEAGSWSAGGSINDCNVCNLPKPLHSEYSTSSGAQDLAAGCEYECHAGYGGSECELCPAGSWSAGGDKTECATCSPEPEASTWALTAGGGSDQITACEYLCDAGYGGTACDVCGEATWSAGGSTDDCSTCIDANAAKPPNSEYTASAHFAEHQDQATACAYACNGDYSGDLCDIHPLCEGVGGFYNPGYNPKHGNGACWKHVSDGKSFIGASESCQDLGGDIAEIRNEQDNALFKLARDTATFLDSSIVWTWFGLTDRISESTWRLLDGTAASYLNWASGQPDDASSNGEDCAYMMESGEWNDLPCDAWIPFICAVPVQPSVDVSCTEEGSLKCHQLAYCEIVDMDGTESCACSEGYHGDGVGEEGCSGEGWAVRFSIFLPLSTSVTATNSVGLYKLSYWDAHRHEYASLLTSDGYATGGGNTPHVQDQPDGEEDVQDEPDGEEGQPAPERRRSLPTNFVTSMEHSVKDLRNISTGYSLVAAAPSGTGYMLTVNAIFADEADALQARDQLENNLQGTHGFVGFAPGQSVPTVFSVTLTTETYPVEPRVYRWVAQSSSAEHQVMPTGLEVQSVEFSLSCETSGCWVVELLFTIGTDNFNTFYIPNAVGDDTLSKDPTYSNKDSVWTDVSPADTFLASNFPCGASDYVPGQPHPFAPISPPSAVTSCCIPEFLDMYRPTKEFTAAMAQASVTKAGCDDGIVQTFARPNWNPPSSPGPTEYDDVSDSIDCTAVMQGLGATLCYSLSGGSGRVDHAYPADDARAWMLVAPGAVSGQALQVVFEFFDTEADADWLEIYSCVDAACSTKTRLVRASGAYNAFAVTSCTGYLLVTFRSDPLNVGPGFMMKYDTLLTCPLVGSETWKSLRAPAADGSALHRESSSRRGTAPMPVTEQTLFGDFSGLNHSSVTFKSVEDPYIGQFRATATFDEVELRRNAGMLKGTVGVEYTVDTFIGLAFFKPSGTQFLDSFATQIGIHLEKTNFFSVSTHGTNQYSLLEYVNLRLVAIYSEDTDPTEAAPLQSDRNGRTNPSQAAHYLQTTFTLGDQYQPIETGLIPLDSVRVGLGEFLSSATVSKDGAPGMFHSCSDYENGVLGGDSTAHAQFNSLFPWETSDAGGSSNQKCAPNVRMCTNPASIPDQFVSFNIPLGIDWLPEPETDLSANVFVDMVISVIDQAQIDNSPDPAPGPNNGNAAEQMKTTLTASIPVVEGGINIFCDGYTAKTDLQDVVKVDLVLGTAGLETEFSRLTVLQDIASSGLQKRDSQQMESDSIESGLMTLILKGNTTYFSQGGTQLYGVQIEDVVTVHIMEPTKDRVDGIPPGCSTGVDCTAAGNKMDQVLDLVETPGDDNNDADGLLTEGYALNGAFSFLINRGAQTASLSPSSSLLAVCPFSPAPPTQDDPFPTTCVTRRDIKQRSYPNRNGGWSTAVEIPAVFRQRTLQEETAGALDPLRDQCGEFMQTVMGESDYAYDLGRNFSFVIAKQYGLNSRYTRAFWINPGYEWTPSQTGGQSKFALSQKILFFALINLDEDIVSSSYSSTDPGNYALPDDSRRRRRMLLTNTGEEQSSVGGAQVTFNNISPQKLVAATLDVPIDLVATLLLVVKLTQEEACASPAERRASMSSTLQEYLEQAASNIDMVTVLSETVSLNGLKCRRRARTLFAFSDATTSVELLVVFSPQSSPVLNLAALEALPAIDSVYPQSISPDVATSRDGDNVPGTGDDVPSTGDDSKPSEASDSETSNNKSNNTLVIAGACGGAGALLLLAGACFVVRRGREEPDDLVKSAARLDGLKLCDELAFTQQKRDDVI